MKPMDFRGRWVLVTGASSGLGQEMARQLARDYGANIVAVARRADRLEALKQELEPSGVKVLPLTADLQNLDDVDRVVKTATDGEALYGAVLNAGITHFGDWHELGWDGFQRMLATNVTSVVRFTTQLLPYLEQKNDGGGVMLVSSMAGLSPVPFQAAYSGTKAFLVHYGCSLYHELQGRNVSITTFAPGGIATEMTEGERFNSLRNWLMPVDRCARSGLEGFRQRKYLHVPGVVYKLLAALSNVAPEPFASSRVAAEYRASLEAIRRENGAS
ncbi:MAG: SDR family NAD(P)-dependent oxidoreductase [Myxococcales bacterium]|nr:SDR family NAD(P)-dependent oxidoreductase [Myxococcales bacterium]